MESYSVEAVLSLSDKGFSSGFKNATASLKSVASGAEAARDSIMKVAAGVGVFKAVSGAVNLLKSSVSSAVSRVDTLNNSSRTFENMGFSAEATKKAMDALNVSIKGMPTSLNDAVSNVELLAASTNDVGKAQEVFAALNDGILGFGGSTAQVQEAVIQLSQAFAGGKVDAATWNSMLNAGLGPALNAIARQMGTTTAALKAGLSDGSISVDQFQSALIDLDRNGGGGMKSLHQIAVDALGGISTSVENAKTAVTRGMAGIIQATNAALSQNKLPTIAESISEAGSLMEHALGAVSKAIPGVISGLVGLTNGSSPLAPVFRVVGAAAGVMVAAIMSASQINSVVVLFGTFKKTLGDVFGLMFKNPFMIILTAVIALTAGVIALNGGFGAMKPILSQIGSSFEAGLGSKATGILKSLGSTILSTISNVEGLVVSFFKAGSATNVFKVLSSVIGVVGKVIGYIVIATNDVISGFNDVGGSGAVWTALKTIFDTVVSTLQTISNVTGAVISALSNTAVASGAWSAIGTALGIVAKGLNAISPIIGTVVSAFLIFKTIAPIFTALGSAVSFVGDAIGVVSAFISAAGGVIEAVGAVISGIGAAIGGPFVIAAAVVAALVAGLVVAYNSFSGFRDFVNSIPATLQSVWQGFVSWFQGIWPQIGTSASTMWTGLVNAAQTTWTVIQTIWSIVAPFFIALWQTIVAAAQVVWNIISTVISTVAQMVMSVWNAVAPFFMALWTGIISIATTLWAGLQQIITALAPIIMAIWAVVGPFFIALWQGIYTAALTIWQGIQTVIQSALTIIQAVISTVLGVISAVWGAVWGVIGSVVTNVWNMIVTVVTTLINVISGVITAILDVIQGNWSGAWDAVKGVASAIWNGIVSLISSFINMVLGVISSVLSGIAAVWSSVWNGIVSVVGAVWNAIKAAVSSAISAVLSVISSILSGIASVWSNVWNGIVTTVSGVWNRIVSTVSKGISNAYKAVTSFVGRMATAGADFVMGFVHGIENTIKSAANAAANMAKAAVESAKKFLHIGSPSKVMRHLGEWTGIGFNNGLESMINDVAYTAQKIASAAVPDVAPADLAWSVNGSSLTDQLSAASAQGSANVAANYTDTINQTSQTVISVDVPLYVNGKEFARATGNDIQSEQTRLQQQDDRIHGRNR